MSFKFPIYDYPSRLLLSPCVLRLVYHRSSLTHCSDPTYSTLVHSCFQYISLLCTRYPPGLCYRPPGHVPTPEIAPELTFVTHSSTGITLPIVPSLQTLVPMTWHGPDTNPDGLYSLPEPSGPCVLPSIYLYIDPKHISTHVSRPPAPDRPPDGSG